MDKEITKKVEKIAEMVAQNKSGPFLFEGMTLPPLPGLYPDTERKLKEIHDFECRQSDVFLCTYPKAGTHWAAELLGMLIKQSPEYDILFVDDNFIEILPNKEELNKAESPRVIISHLPYNHLPQQVRNGIGKIIYIQRNPKDLFVSLFNFQIGKRVLGDKTTWEQFFDTMFTDDALYGGWFRYTKDWEEQLSNTNILPLYYEDMKNDLTAYVLKIAKFIDISCSEELANQISEKCSFENMKNNKVDNTHNLNSSGHANQPLYRKGMVGDWNNLFTVGQNERFDEYYKEHMIDSKLKFQYQL